MGSQRCVAVLTSHLVLGVLCLVVGFLCPFHFGWYDSCDLIEPERTFDGWSIYRDMSDFYILLIFIGFILLGVAFGIIGFVQNSYIICFSEKRANFSSDTMVFVNNQKISEVRRDMNSKQSNWFVSLVHFLSTCR